MNKKTKTVVSTIVFLGLGIALMYWILGKVGLDEIVTGIKKANYFYVGLALLAGIISHLVRALRWNLLIIPMGYSASIAGSFHAVILGYLVNTGLPRVGEITRPAVLSKLEGIPFNKLVGTVLTERIIDLIITLLIAISIVLIQFQRIQSYLSTLTTTSSSYVFFLVGIVLLAIVAWLAIKYRHSIYKLPIINKFTSFIEGVVEGFQSILKMKKRGLFIFYSLFIWFMYLLMPYFILLSLQETLHLGIGAALTILLFGTAGMIIPVPGGIGTFHVLVIGALAIYGIGEEPAGIYAVLTHSIQTIVVIGVGIFSILYFIIKNQKIKNELATNSQ